MINFRINQLNTNQFEDDEDENDFLDSFLFLSFIRNPFS